MPDTRTRRQKLEAMASQMVSPNEAEIARAKLRDIPPSDEELYRRAEARHRRERARWFVRSVDAADRG